MISWTSWSVMFYSLPWIALIVPFPLFCFYSCLRAGIEKLVENDRCSDNIGPIFVTFLENSSLSRPFLYTLFSRSWEGPVSVRADPSIYSLLPSPCAQFLVLKGVSLLLDKNLEGPFINSFFLCHWKQTEQCFLEAWEPNSNSWLKVAVKCNCWKQS